MAAFLTVGGANTTEEHRGWLDAALVLTHNYVCVCVVTNKGLFSLVSVWSFICSLTICTLKNACVCGQGVCVCYRMMYTVCVLVFDYNSSTMCALHVLVSLLSV